MTGSVYLLNESESEPLLVSNKSDVCKSDQSSNPSQLDASNAKAMAIKKQL